MLIAFSKSDINPRLAYESHRGTSWTPERRAEQEVESYLRYMAAISAEFEQWVTETNRDEMTGDLELYRATWVQKVEAYWRAHSRVISAAIVGPARFPTRTNQKRGDTADKRRSEWLDWNEKALDKLRRKYNPRLASRVIRSDDADAIAKLQAKIDRARRLQDVMKAANKVCRQKGLTDDERVSALGALGLSRIQAAEIMTPDYMGRIGFPSYALSNNNANIRRMEQRIKELQAEAERRTGPGAVDEYELGGARVVENADTNRLQVIFDAKPPAEVRARLKARGFHWSEGAWQRLLNEAAREAARDILKGER